MMVAVTADGHNLLQFGILRRTTFPTDTFPPEIIVRVQDRGWMTEDLILEWLNVAWKSGQSL
jgi:hypothetical protein